MILKFFFNFRIMTKIWKTEIILNCATLIYDYLIISIIYYNYKIVIVFCKISKKFLMHRLY